MPELKRLAFVFKLRLTGAQEHDLRCFSGAARFLWNQLLADWKEDYQDWLDEIESRQCWGEADTREEARRISSRPPECTGYGFSYSVKRLRQQFPFLKACPAQALQQKANDLSSSFEKCFKDRRRGRHTGFPKFKKKSRSTDSFRYPQDFKVDERNGRVFLPKIGWVRYRKSRDFPEGARLKNLTVTHAADGWYVSIQFEFAATPAIEKPDLSTAVGIDMGVARFATVSDGSFEPGLETLLCEAEEKIQKAQKNLSRKQKGSRNWQKAQEGLSKLFKRKTDLRYNFLHQYSAQLVKNHDVICVEDLKIRNMMKSARGTVSAPGKNVRQKAGLNRAIADQAWGKFRKLLGYKLDLKGGLLVQVDPRNTSRTCIRCGCVDKGNRPLQALFRCVRCGYSENADLNAAQNIRRAGLARIASEVNCSGSQQEEPAEEAKGMCL